MLDFDKVFDRIKWGFLFKALEKLSFFFNGLNEFLPYIGWFLLQSNLIGNLATLLWFKNLLDKGCLLTLYVRIFIIDVLGYSLDNLKYGSKVLTLPRGGYCKDI